MRKGLLIWLCIGCFLSASGAKKKGNTPEAVKLKTVFNTAKDALKNNRNHQNAEKTLLEALSRTDLDRQDSAKIYYTAALLQQGINGIQNQKAYLKQSYDTSAFFSSTLALYQHLMRCDSLDLLPNEKGTVKRHYKSKINSLMKRHRKNLINGGIYQMRKGDYARAYDYMDAYIISSSDHRDSLLSRAAYWATICGYNIKNPTKTRKYLYQAQMSVDDKQKAILQEYKSRTYLWENNREEWYKSLEEGIKKYPQHEFFLLNLLDWYSENHLYEKGMALADSLLTYYTEKPIFWYAKSMLSLGLEDYKSCIVSSDSCIARDPKYADAYYNKGIAYCNMALFLGIDAEKMQPKEKEDLLLKQKDLYLLARPCLEKVRELQPDNASRWAMPLYRIYLNLNMGKEFDEMDEIIKKLK